MALGPILFALLACGSQEASLGGPSGARVGPAAAAQDMGPVSGTVVDPQTFEPLAGRTIFIGAQRTTSDANGAFTVERVPGSYDLTVVDADRSIVSIYKGLNRRDPKVIHRTNPYARWDRAHSAMIRGKLSGGGAYPLPKGSASIGFVPRDGAVTVQEALLGGKDSKGTGDGPGYAGLRVAWNQPGPVSGELTAIRLSDFVRDPKGGLLAKMTKLSWAFGHRSIVLNDGDHLVADLDLVPVPTVRVTVRVDVAGGNVISSLGQWYRTPSLGSVFNVWNEEVNHSSVSYETDIADLRAFGASLCTFAGRWDGGMQTTDKCSPSLDQQVWLRLEPAPTLLKPTSDITPTAATNFAWTSFSAGIHVLSLEPAAFTETDPAICVYTSATSSAWPDVGAAGVLFPEGPATYKCTISGLGPYASMDAAVGSDGIGSRAFMERQVSESSEVRFKFPAPARAWPPCNAPPYIACGSPQTESYGLEKMNLTLRLYPRFAAASGLRCVRDCEGARAWTKAHDAYSKSHFGFDFNEVEKELPPPLPPEPPPGPPPPHLAPAPAR